jgi:hypothetical protein
MWKKTAIAAKVVAGRTPSGRADGGALPLLLLLLLLGMMTKQAKGTLNDVDDHPTLEGLEPLQRLFLRMEMTL